MNRRNLKNVEWGILISSILLFVIGCIALFSATDGTEHEELIKQLQWFGICVPVVIAIMLMDYKTIIKLSPVFYGIFLILLVIVLFTKPINGATSWFDLKFFAFQPAEFAKIFVICFMAYIMSIYNKNGKEEINRPLKLLSLLLIVGAPVLLIVKQPDYRNCCGIYCCSSIYAFCRWNKKEIYNNINIISCNTSSNIIFIYFARTC